MIFRNILALSALFLMLASCGDDSTRKDDQPVTAAHQSKPLTEEAALRDKAPKGLMARVRMSDLNSQKSQIELVSLNQSPSVGSGSDAAKLFAAGKPMQIRFGSAGLEAINEDHTVALATAPKSANLLPSIISLGQYFPNSNCTTNCGTGSGLFGSIFDVLGGLIGGAGGTIGRFLSFLNPLSLFRNLGLGFNGDGSFSYNGHQYFPYQPGTIINYPGTPPNGNNPGGQPTYPQYPNQPSGPTGQEPRPLHGQD